MEQHPPDPRQILRDRPWAHLDDEVKAEVLATTAAWSHIADGLFMGGCLVRPDDFDVVVTLDERVAVFPELDPDRGVDHVVWTFKDQAVPDVGRLEEVTAAIVEHLDNDRRVLVRCLAGLNRSGLVCASVLIRRGWSPDGAIEQVRTSRSPHALCNEQFVDHLASRAR